MYYIGIKFKALGWLIWILTEKKNSEQLDFSYVFCLCVRLFVRVHLIIYPRLAESIFFLYSNQIWI